MNLAEIIAALQGGGNPNQAVINAFTPRGGTPENPSDVAPMYPSIPAAGAAPAASSSAALTPPITGAPAPNDVPQESPVPAQPIPASTTPKGIPTPVTNPSSPTTTPAAMQSPPDLANMYLKIMEKNQNAAQLDSGLTMIAAGLTPHAATRQALIGAATGGGGGSKGITSADLINLQKADQANKDMLLRRSILGGLAKQYNLSPEAALALETSGKLDEVIAAHNTGHLTKVTDAATGQDILIHPITGKEIVRIGGPKPPETQVVEGPGGPELRRKDTFERVGEPAGIKPSEDKRTFEEINAERAKAGEPLITREQYETTIKRAPPVDPAAKDREILADINKDRAAANKPLMTMEEYKQKFGKAGVTVNVGPEGQKFPALEKGEDYIRNEDGTVKVFEDGKPRVYGIEGSKQAAEIAAAEQKNKKATEVDINKARARYASVSSVMRSVDDAKRIINAAPAWNPAVGFGSSVGAQFGGTPATNVKSPLAEITAQTGFQQLQAMREASPTGGALGQVSDFENKLLAASIGDLNQAQSKPEILRKLDIVKATMILLAENKFNSVEEFTNARNKLLAEWGQSGEKIGNNDVRPRMPGGN